MLERLTLKCGRVVEVKAIHWMDVVEFLETGGVLTWAGRVERWKQHIVETAPSRMDDVWGKRKTIFIQDAEPDTPRYFLRPSHLPPWVIHAWLHSEESTRGDPNYKSQLALFFFQNNLDNASKSMDHILRDAIRALDWNALAEDIPADRWEGDY